MTCRECGAKIDRRMVTCPRCMRVLDAEPTPMRAQYDLPVDFLDEMAHAPIGHALQVMDGLTGECFYLQKVTAEVFQAAYDAAVAWVDEGGEG